MKNNIFKNRSLCVIDDFSLDERIYFFNKVTEFKNAWINKDKDKINSFIINDPYFKAYLVFLENSTRTKESTKNALIMHKIPFLDFDSNKSSFNKGESYLDGFNNLIGYGPNVFFVRSTIEGLCTALEDSSNKFIERHYEHNFEKPSFINCGDGKHEHPTQELLDEFSFLEYNKGSRDKIHIALIGDLLHGRTIHSKANGLKGVFNNVKIDLIAPDELKLPSNYERIMIENNFEINKYESLDEYLSHKNIAKLFYFTRLQLERMGENIRMKEKNLRKKVTLTKEHINILNSKNKDYHLFHPLPRIKNTPTIPFWVDPLKCNAYEKQSINGLYCRAVLLSLIGGRIGSDFEGRSKSIETYENEFITYINTSSSNLEKHKFKEGIKSIQTGIVIDHIAKGKSLSEIGHKLRTIEDILKINSEGGFWKTHSPDGLLKGLYFIPYLKELSYEQLKKLAALAPKCRVNYIKDHSVTKKIELNLPSKIEGYHNLECNNPNCISRSELFENVTPIFNKQTNDSFKCKFCSTNHSYDEIWKS